MTDGPRICIDARLKPGFSGGIEQVVIGLAQGLSSLDDGDENYYFLTYAGADDWLTPYIQGPCQVLHTEQSRQQSWRRAIAARAPAIKRLLEWLAALAVKKAVNIPASNGTIERSNIDLMHFTLQSAFLTDVPSIYHPHDLQHLHLPEYFSRYEREGRSVVYKRFSDQARMLAVSSSWVRQDLVDNLGIPRDKIAVVPLAPATEGYGRPTSDQLASVRAKFALPEAFIFYPAQTWPHKNHIGLIEAAARVRDRHGERIQFVFSGRISEHHSMLEKRVNQLDLAEQVRFLGFVTPMELQCLYRLCRGVAIPTKFEAASFPLWEAFLAEAPTACSNVTSLPTQAGDAALVFDPDDSDDIARNLYELWTDEALRKKLSERGAENVKRFTWQKTALHFRAVYRQVLGLQLSGEDQAILSAKPII